MSAKDISNLIGGEEGTVVKLRINRPGSSEFNLILFRQQIINHNIDKDYFNRCLARFQLKDYGDALGDCNESIQINPNNDKAYFLLSGVHFKLGNKYQEIENLQKAARLGNKKAREILKKIQQLPGNQ